MEKFNKEFFKTEKNIEWFGEKGISKRNENINATITIVTHGHSDQYEGYKVEIIHKNNGKIDSHYFPFNDYLKTRIDDRNDYKGKFEVSKHCGKCWYIAIPKPKEVDEMVKIIFKYIKNWD